MSSQGFVLKNPPRISDDDKCCKVSEGAGKAFPCLVSSGLVAPVTNTFVGSLVQGVGGGVGGGCMKERGRFWEKFCRKFGSSSSFSLCTICVTVALGMTSGSIITSLYGRSLADLLFCEQRTDDRQNRMRGFVTFQLIGS